MCYPNADFYSCVVKTQVAYPYQKYLFICTISDYLDSEKPTFDLSVAENQPSVVLGLFLIIPVVRNRPRIAEWKVFQKMI